jgi:3-methylfumaryl-CoA hydratase
VRDSGCPVTDFTAWLGRRRHSDSRLDPWPVQALTATLGIEAVMPTGTLPVLWQWLYFLETPRHDQLGRDGHPRKGDFYPPIEQPRRMFVGGRCQVVAPLRIGEPARLTETVLRCEPKRGGSGPMTLLTVGYEYSQGDRRCVLEERDFMYLPDRVGGRADTRPAEEVPVAEAVLAKDVATDPVLLFKFSALTFNGHRIHYDGDYAREVEGYPERVVHGPLTALLLATLAAAHAGPILRFSFRALAPLFVGDRIRLRGDTIDETIKLSAYRPDGRVAMTAEAER